MGYVLGAERNATLVKEVEVEDVNSYTFDNLNGDVDDEYYLTIDIDQTTPSYLKLRFNEDSNEPGYYDELGF